MILLVEGARASGELRPDKVSRVVRSNQVTLGEAFLIGRSTFQGEFDYAVPQVRLVFHPILLMLAAMGWGLALLQRKLGARAASV